MILTTASFKFCENQPHNALLQNGWGEFTPGAVWTNEARAAIKIPLPPPRPAAGTEWEIELSIDPQKTFAVVRNVSVALFLNDQQVAIAEIGGPYVLRARVPPAILGDEPLTITLACQASDRDILGVKLSALRLLLTTPFAQPAIAHLILQTPIGWNEKSQSLLKSGFGTPEDTYAWMIGARSVFEVPVPADATHVSLMLDLFPFAGSDKPARQRVALGVDQRLLGYLDVRDRLILAFNVQKAPGQTHLTVSFDNLDAAFETTDPLFHFGKPFACALAGIATSDALPTAIPSYRDPVPGNLRDGSLLRAITDLTGLAPAELAAQFEAMGNGCAVPHAQCILGDRRNGLLQHAGAWQTMLVQALLDGFAQIGRADSYQWRVRFEVDLEWRISVGAYNIELGTPFLRSSPVPANGFVRAAKVFPRLAEKLLEQIANDEKIFVLRIAEAPTGFTAEAAAMAVFAALRKWGNPRLLWLVTNNDKPAGCAEMLNCGIVRGYLEPDIVGQRSDEMATSCLANAWVLFEEAGLNPPT